MRVVGSAYSHDSARLRLGCSFSPESYATRLSNTVQRNCWPSPPVPVTASKASMSAPFVRVIFALRLSDRPACGCAVTATCVTGAAVAAAPPVLLVLPDGLFELLPL